ncbi:hypothetical protein SEA_MABODAMACA_69 [Microbacterium phage Mabodamaca]|uniref:Uncharacterized protein n=1 Tax=Microbacterium phage Mabodamaca TaxID=3078574 RepID=A0AA96SFY0_9CAUD|nr:hypothetical protein SEA_MABODAMACA_69 [Microbacterium phage Mabodamaca]
MAEYTVTLPDRTTETFTSSRDDLVAVVAVYGVASGDEGPSWGVAKRATSFDEAATQAVAQAASFGWADVQVIAL